MSRPFFTRDKGHFAKRRSAGVHDACKAVAERLEDRLFLSASQQLGINIRRLGYDSGDELFADAMKEGNTWSTNFANPLDVSAPAPIDSNGFPTSDASITVIQNGSNDGGTYALSFTGQATVSPIASEPGVTIANLSYNAGANQTTAQVIVPNGSQALMLDFTNTRRLPTDTGATGISNVQLMRPESVNSSVSYPSSTLFSTPILNLISKFTTIRYMDYSLTNFNPQVNWSDRTLPSQVQVNGKGGSWEYAVALANTAGKDMWINIPEMATNDYITKLAQLINYGSDGVNPYTGPAGTNPVPAGGPVYAGLNSNLHVYVEYSNEVWNTSFSQNQQNASAAIAEVNAGGSPLNFDNNSSPTTWAARRTAERTVDTSNIFRSVFGDAQMMTQVRPVYQWQYANLNNTASNGLVFLNNLYNNANGVHVANPHPVNYYLWGGGGGWYGGIQNPNGTGDVNFVNPNFASPVVSGAKADSTGATWSFSGSAGIVANGSALGNPSSTNGTQAAYLQPGGSFSQTVNFTGGLADLIFSAAVTGTARFTVSVDGVNVSGAWALSSAYSLQHTNAFDTGASGTAHTLTFTATSGTGSVFISYVLPETVNGIYKSIVQDITSTTRNESEWAAAFGLHMVSYEGGFNFGTGNTGTPLQIAANQDPRAESAAIAQMNEFFAAGGELGMFYDTTNHIWALTLDINNQNTPKIQAVNSVLSSPAVALNIGATLPTTAGQSVTIANDLAGSAGAAGIYAFNAPVAGTYTVTLAGSQTGSAAEQFMLDGQFISGTATLPSTPGNSSPLTFTVATPGLHALLLVVSGAGSISPNNPAGAVTITAGTSSNPPPPPPSASISGTVFNDTNKDGVQDDGETGVAGVRVYMDPNYSHTWDTATEQGTLTDASGDYTFTDLPADPEILRVVLPSGAQQTFPAAGAGDYVGKNTGQTLIGEDFGIYAPVVVAGASVTGVVFNDANTDGSQDNSEAGVSGVMVYVDLNNSDAYVSGDPNGTTNSQGVYTITGITPGSYVVRENVPVGDAQISPANGSGISVALTSGQSVGGVNFGLSVSQTPPPPSGSISGTVFNDANRDGVQDNGETGVAGVRVYMDPDYSHSWNSATEQGVLTDASGNFIFPNPPADPEILRVVLPGGAQQTFPASSAGVYVGKNTGQTLTGQNFGIFTPVVGTNATINGSVFNDLNGDHAQGTGEPNLANATVYIDSNNDGILDGNDPTAVTTASGTFSFTGLSAGTYTVYVSPAPGYRQTLPTAGGTKVTVSAGGSVSAGKFGVTNTAYVGGVLFNDANGNGVQNSGEGYLSGWTVYLDLNNDGQRESNEPTAVTTTTSVGYWYFRAVAAGNYTIRAVAPSGYTLTKVYTITLASGATVTNGAIGAKK